MNQHPWILCNEKILNIAQMAITLLLLELLIRHGDRPHNYVSNDIIAFSSPGLTKILPIEKCIFFRHPVSMCDESSHNHYMLST